MKITTGWLNTHSWMIRMGEHKTYGGFRWKPKGQWTVAPDWTLEPSDRGGLFGVAPCVIPKIMVYRFLWLCETLGPHVSVGDSIIKVPQARIIAVDDEIPSEALAACNIHILHDGDVVPRIDSGLWVCLWGEAYIDTMAGGSLIVVGGDELGDGEEAATRVTIGAMWRRSAVYVNHSAQAHIGAVWHCGCVQACDRASVTITEISHTTAITAKDCAMVEIGDAGAYAKARCYGDTATMTIKSDHTCGLRPFTGIRGAIDQVHMARYGHVGYEGRLLEDILDG